MLTGRPSGMAALRAADPHVPAYIDPTDSIDSTDPIGRFPNHPKVRGGKPDFVDFVDFVDCVDRPWRRRTER